MLITSQTIIGTLFIILLLKKMIRSGQDIPEELVDDDVYYNRVSGKSSTRGLRDFHNQYVKKLLVTSVAKKR